MHQNGLSTKFGEFQSSWVPTYCSVRDIISSSWWITLCYLLRWNRCSYLVFSNIRPASQFFLFFKLKNKSNWETSSKHHGKQTPCWISLPSKITFGRGIAAECWIQAGVIYPEQRRYWDHPPDSRQLLLMSRLWTLPFLCSVYEWSSWESELHQAYICKAAFKDIGLSWALYLNCF